MKNKFLLVILFVFSSLIAIAQDQFELDGVVIPRRIEVNNKKTLDLNGFGKRSKAWMDLYVQALYLSQLTQDPKAILDSETDMAVRLEVTSKLITSEKLSKALNKGIVKSYGEENVAKIQKHLDDLERLLTSEKTNQKDVFVLSYNPLESSIWIYKNDQFRGKINGGSEFKKAFFGIWLSDNPVDKDLKNELLGKE